MVTPLELYEWKEILPDEKFVLSQGEKWIDMVLEQTATGADALKGWLVAAYTARMRNSSPGFRPEIVQEAYEKVNSVFNPFLEELHSKGWHTDRFLDGTGVRFSL